MPAGIASDAGLTVPLSFSNNFWGRDDAGVEPLLARVQGAKATCDELKSFYSARAALEEDYARKLLQLSRKPLGSNEMGTLRASLDVARGETETMGKQHTLIAQQMRSDLEEPLVAFAGGMKERRKIVQNGIERLLKTKQAQTAQVTKSRDKYEQDCLRIKGYLAQGHMVMGQEERKNKAKLEKTQINMASNSNEYESAVKVLEETTGRWNKEWKAACDKFQDLEEERLDFMKSSLWAYANIASTVCVSDDASCEKIRIALEHCEVEKDVMHFFKTCGTGQEIPDPPRYINFCRGDIDSASEVSEDDNYSVAQFQRTTNPAFRSSSPNPTNNPAQPDSLRASEERDSNDDMPVLSHANSGRPAPLNFRQADPNVPPNYSPSQHGAVPQVPHNQYPTDGMTMFCRTDTASVADTVSNGRPESRDSQSEYSAPSSFTSAEPMSGKNSPTKGPPVNGVPLPGMISPNKGIQKKRSGFFSNSPFRRKSKKEQENPVQVPGNRNTWNPTGSSFNRIDLNPSNVSNSSAQSSPTKPSGWVQNTFNRNAGTMAPEGEEPADPRANFQLNIGNNVFDVASPDSHQSTPKASVNNARRGQFNMPPQAIHGDAMSLDPIAQALANLKQSSSGATAMAKPASSRVPVDRYHGVATPAPDQNPASRPSVVSAESQSRIAAQRGTPPPAYDSSAPRAQSALGVPQPAHTKREMMNRTQTWGTNPSTYGGREPQSTPSRPTSRNNGRRSPAPDMRAASPQPQNYIQQQPQMRARSPAPSMMRSHSPGPDMMRAHSPGPSMMQQNAPAQDYRRSASPNPYASTSRSRAGGPPSNQRQNSGMEMQLSGQYVSRPGDSGSGSDRQQMRPASSYGGDPYQGSQSGQIQHQGFDSRIGMRRERSKSVANVPLMGRNGPSQPLHFARAMYSYTAAIPEELTFAKNDILAVLRIQDDGWWEAEVRESAKGTRAGAAGLVPSNYLQRC